MKKTLLRIYPRSWRKRYGPEMEVLVEEMPGRLGVALDLLVGAAIAYRDVIRRDRVLSAAGAYLHGLCVAVLVQAIAFVALVLAGQGSADPTELHVGPVDLATVVGVAVWQRQDSLALQPALIWVSVARSWVPELALLLGLVFALAMVLAAPRLLRSLR